MIETLQYFGAYFVVLFLVTLNNIKIKIFLEKTSFARDETQKRARKVVVTTTKFEISAQKITDLAQATITINGCSLVNPK